MKETDLSLRALEARDINAVLAIQAASPEAACWNREAYDAMLVGGLDRAIVAERPNGLAGFASYRVIVPEAELLNLAILPDCRRQGIAARLLGEVLRAARECGVSDLYLEVREGNVAALRLYQRFGFEIASRRPGYYHNPPADALTLRCRVGRVRT